MGIRAKGNTVDRAELATLIAKSRLPYSRFALCMGVPCSTIQGYLSGTRSVPKVAVSAAKWTLLNLGISVEIDRTEIVKLLPASRRRRNCKKVA